jgi:hypothetical protein
VVSAIIGLTLVLLAFFAFVWHLDKTDHPAESRQVRRYRQQTERKRAQRLARLKDRIAWAKRRRAG